jgi:hypothetical protein
MKDRGSANIPPNWIERARDSRKNREARVAGALNGTGIEGVLVAEDWELAYRKECFYRGLRILLELERGGESDI